MPKKKKKGYTGEQLLIFSDTPISKFTGLFHRQSFEMGAKLINERLKEDPNAKLLHLGDIPDSGTRHQLGLYRVPLTDCSD